MILEVTTDGPVPPYEQVRGQIETMAASGVLSPGHRLPSIRQLASDLGLAPGTVARAYRELESAGVVATRAGRGTTIAAAIQPLSEQARHGRLLDAARLYVAAVQRLGATRDQAVGAVTQVIAAEL